MDDSKPPTATSGSSDDLMIGIKRQGSDVFIDPAKKMAKVTVAAPNSMGTVSVATSIGSVAISNQTSSVDHKPLNKVHSDSIGRFIHSVEISGFVC